MTSAEVAAALDRSAIVLDMRPPLLFAAGHLPGAINLQFNRADLGDRALMVLPQGAEYIVLAEPDAVASAGAAILRDAGFKVAGHLSGGLQEWATDGRPVERLAVIDVDELSVGLDHYHVVDAREGYEYRHGHIAGAVLFPSGEAWTRVGELPSDLPLAVVCGSQVRSSLVASILQCAGRQPVLVRGGMAEWLERAYPVEKAVPISA